MPQRPYGRMGEPPTCASPSSAAHSHPSSPALIARSLLAPTVLFLPPARPRTVSTILAPLPRALATLLPCFAVWPSHHHSRPLPPPLPAAFFVSTQHVTLAVAYCSPSPSLTHMEKGSPSREAVITLPRRKPISPGDDDSMDAPALSSRKPAT